MKNLALLLMVITGCCAEEDLHGASFVFYKTSTTARVILKPRVSEPLGNMTVCLQSYTDHVRYDSLFKLVADNSASLFHLFLIADYYYINIDGDQIYYQTGKESMKWRLICVSWESSTGIIHVVVNGKLFPRSVLKPGFIINPNFTAVLGQHISSVVGLTSFSGEPCFVGEMTEVHMWDRALLPSVMESLYRTMCLYCHGNIIDWKSVDYEVIGDIVLYKPPIKP